MATPPPITPSSPHIMNYGAYVDALHEVPYLQENRIEIPAACRSKHWIEEGIWEACIEAVCNESSLQDLRPTSNASQLDFFAQNVGLAMRHSLPTIERDYRMSLNHNYIRYSVIRRFRNILCEDRNSGGPPLAHLSWEALSQLSAAATVLAPGTADDDPTDTIPIEPIFLLGIVQYLWNKIPTLVVWGNPATRLLLAIFPPPPPATDPGS